MISCLESLCLELEFKKVSFFTNSALFVQAICFIYWHWNTSRNLRKIFYLFALDCNGRYVQRAYGDLNKIYLWLLQEIACADTPRETSMIKPFAKINCGFKSEICQECVDCSTRTFCRETCWIFFSVPILFPNTSTHVFAHEHTVRNVFIPKHIIFYIFF